MKSRALVTMILSTSLVLMVTGGFLAKPAARKTDIVVSAAASLSDVMQALKADYERTHEDVSINLNLGSSGSLRYQIEKGAPVDLFVSASTHHVNALVDRGLIAPSAVKRWAANEIVLVGHKSGKMQDVHTWDALLANGVERIGIGNPQHVPAGQYGKEVLQSLGLWGRVGSKLILGADVRQVLHYVETGEVDAGIVYRTDAVTSRQVKILAKAPPGSHKPVVYPVGVVQGARYAREAAQFMEYLFSKDAEKLLTSYGFGINGR